MTISLEDRDAVRAMLRRAAIVAVNDGGAQQLVDLSGFASDQPKKIVRISDFGLASNPPAGGEGLIVCPGGRSDRAMFIGGEHKQYRPKNLAAGAVALYSTQMIITLGATTLVVDTGGKMLYLGGDPAKGNVFAPVQTASGPSPFVQARIS